MAWQVLRSRTGHEEFCEFSMSHMCQGLNSLYWGWSSGDGHPTFNRNPFNGYINPYYWVDDHPLLYGNNGSLDPGTYVPLQVKP